MHRRRLIAALVLLFALALPTNGVGYSVLTHEEIIDLAWNHSMQPLLLQRFPSATAEDLRHAHAYAYGGSVIQDLGYYPFGDKFFSDLTHYVRTGDFVANMLADAVTLNDYAFALGALAHYVSDIQGHPYVNRAVPIEYPKLRSKFGEVVTYDEARVEHLQTEFGFDVVQVAKGRYAPKSYHDFIDFKVSKPLLERAFERTYGLPLKSVLKHEDLAIGTYRRSVSTIIPKMTKVALATRGKQMEHEIPNFNRKLFLYRLSRTDYERDWGREYARPGVGARVVAFFLRLVPKVGPLRGLAYKDPTPKTEDLYMKSVNQTVSAFEQALEKTRVNDPSFAHFDLDTGAPAKPAEYGLADRTYLELVRKLQDDKFAHMDRALQSHLESYFSGLPTNAKITSDKHWPEDQKSISALRSFVAPKEVTDPPQDATSQR